MIRDWLLGDESVTAEELAASYKYLLSHSVLDMIQLVSLRYCRGGGLIN